MRSELDRLGHDRAAAAVRRGDERIGLPGRYADTFDRRRVDTGRRRRPRRDRAEIAPPLLVVGGIGVAFIALPAVRPRAARS